MEKRILVYLAGPLFSLAEREFNTSFAKVLRERMPRVDVILPQEKAAAIASTSAFLSEMYAFCIEMVERCDCVVAILDGPDADSGTCVEIGHARATGKPVIGIRTDPRSSEDKGLNLMVSRTCSELLWDSRASVEELAQRVGDAISRLLQHRGS